MITIEWIALNGKSNGICKQSKYLECENQKYDAQWHRIESCCVFTSICFGFIWIFLFYFIFQFALKFNSFHWNERIRVRARPQPMPLIRPTVQISTHSHINKPNWINQFFSMLLLFRCSAARVRQREEWTTSFILFSSPLGGDWRWRWVMMKCHKRKISTHSLFRVSSQHFLLCAMCRFIMFTFKIDEITPW